MASTKSIKLRRDTSWLEFLTINLCYVRLPFMSSSFACADFRSGKDFLVDHRKLSKPFYLHAPPAEFLCRAIASARAYKQPDCD